MITLPKFKTVFRSGLSMQDVADRLQAKVEPAKTVRFNRSTGFPFEGTVNPQSFQLRRILNYRNSFAPDIKGKISDDAFGSRIEVTFSIHPLAFVLFAFILGIGMLVTAIIMFASFSSGGFNLQALLPVIALPAAVAIFYYAFHSERKTSTQLLENIFQAEAESPSDLTVTNMIYP